MIAPQLIQPMPGVIRLIIVAILILVGSRLEAKPAELVFTYWGSPFERQAVKKVLQHFNQQQANIRVRAQHISFSNYTTKLLTMVAAGTAPDIAYIPDPMISKWASAGWLMDLSDYFQNDPEANTRIRRSIIRFKLRSLAPIAVLKLLFLTTISNF